MVEVMQDMGGWRPAAIMNEAFRLVWKYFWLFRPIFLQFLLPLWLVLLLHLVQKVIFSLPTESPFTTVILSWLLVIYGIATIAKAVEHIYTDRKEQEEDHSIVIKSIKESPWEASPRFLITSVWIYVVYIILLLVFVCLPNEKATGENIQLVFRYASALVLDLMFFLFEFLLQVAVLEPESYHLKRALKLLQAKWLTALALIVFYTLLFACFLGFITTGKLSWRWCIVMGLLELVWFALMAMWFVVMAVFYFSCKQKCQQLLPVHDLSNPLAVSADNKETREEKV